MSKYLRVAAIAAAMLLFTSCGAKDAPQVAKPDGVIGALGLDAPEAPSGKPHHYSAILEASEITFREPESNPDVMGEEWDLAKDDDVYVVGQCNRLFKNGMSYGLGYPEIRFGYSVFVSGGDVCVACDTHPPRLGADPGVFLWKNGAGVRLEGVADGIFARANGVAVSPSGDVYVAGYLQPSGALWVNGRLQRLSGGGGAGCVAVSGEDVYVGGSESGTAVIWKNGVKQTLTYTNPIGRYATVYSLFVSGDDVYAAVPDYIDADNMYGGTNRPLLWKNGEFQVLPNDGEYGARALGVSVSAAGDVYAVGNEWDLFPTPTAVFWKNGVEQKLPGWTRETFAQSIAVSGENVYIAGLQVTDTDHVVIPTLWINGEAVDLRPSGFKGGAFSVFVAPKEVTSKEKEKVEPTAGDHDRPAPWVAAGVASPKKTDRGGSLGSAVLRVSGE